MHAPILIEEYCQSIYKQWEIEVFDKLDTINSSFKPKYTKYEYLLKQLDDLD